MDPRAASHGPSPTPPRPRVWQDVIAETLLCLAVVLIALTGSNSVVRQINLWLAALIPAYDPMVTMLALVVVVISGLILGSVGLKMAAQRASEAASMIEPARRRPARSRRTLPYVGS